MRTLFDTYIEILQFLESCGGPYATHDDETCFNLAECLHNGQYVIERDEHGDMTFFLNYWVVTVDELDNLKDGGKPADVSTGTMPYVLDCAYKGRNRNFRTVVGNALRPRFAGEHGIAWHHKMKTQEAFRYFPSQKGIQNG